MIYGENAAIFGLALGLNTLGAVMLKKGACSAEAGGGSVAGNAPVFTLRMLRNRAVAIGLLLQVGAMIGWLGFISRAALSVAFPLSSVSNVTILLASHYLLGERISPRRWAGVALILGGIILIANV